MKKFIIRVAGLFVSFSGLFSLIALLSFKASDPSINTATSFPASNILGKYGAIVADLLLQFLGFAAVIPCFVVLIWGILVAKNCKIKHFCLKTVSLIISTICGSIFLSEFSLIKAWPVMSGFGGSLGYVLNSYTIKVLPILDIPQQLTWFTAIIFLFIAIFGLSLALGLPINIWSKLAGLSLSKKTNVTKTAPKETKPIIKPKTEPKKDKEREKEPERKEPVIKITNLKLDTTENLVERTEENDSSESKPDYIEPIIAQKPEQKYALPPLSLLSSNSDDDTICDLSDDELNQNARKLEAVLNEFGIKGNIVKIRPGPVVTLYELDPAPGTKTSRVVGLADDIARSMSAISVRIAVVSGSNTIGIELPNDRRKTVYLKDLLCCHDFNDNKIPLLLALGKDIGGRPVFADLARMPHLLIAGTTGSGKSVAVNSMILSILFRLTPKQCRLIMIDPKMLEFTPYNNIPHLLTPVVTDPAKAVVALKWAVREMEDRYKAMSIMGVRNIDSYNLKLTEAVKKGEVIKRTVKIGFDPETGLPVYEEQELNLTPFPYIVVIVDEMADLMMVAGKDVELAIQRLAQMARAAGIHIIMATQRPSVDVITGTIKANFPTRISFNVTSKIDSRTILGEQGAEQLLGRGDMLYMASGMRPIRVHGPFVEDGERDAVIEYLKTIGEPEYINAVVYEEHAMSDFERAMNASGASSSNSDDENSLYDQAVAIVLEDRKVSTSYIQRKLRIGYNRAAELVERMEKEGLISPANHVGKREILIS